MRSTFFFYAKGPQPAFAPICSLLPNNIAGLPEGLKLLLERSGPQIVAILTKTANMRTTWIILLLMLLAGGIMYYFAKKEKPLAAYDTIALINTPDSIKQKTRLFVAYDPKKIRFHDSAWTMNDSLPLQSINLDSASTSFNKNYPSVTFYLVYNNQFFYDVEVPKRNPTIPYNIRFQIQGTNGNWLAKGSVDSVDTNLYQFQGPMMKMYRSFVVNYNDKLPVDSAQLADTGTRANKTIVVLEN